MKLVPTTLLALAMLPAGFGCSQSNTEDPAASNTGPGTPEPGPMGSPTDPSSTGGPGTSPPSPGGGGTGGGQPAPTGAGGTAGTGGTGASGPAGTGGTAGSGAGGSGAGGSGAGGSGAGGSGAGGSGAGGGGAGGSGAEDLSPDTIIPGMDGLFWAFRAMNPDATDEFMYLVNATGEECPVGDSWATSGATREQTFQAMGTAGQKYTVNFELRGALGLRCYTDGTPTGMVADPAGVNEAFYVGGQQFGDSFLNTVELAVTPPVADETASNYFLNGIPSTSEMCDAEITYDVQYKAQFVIMGDSTITLQTRASDCRMLQNCGADPAGAGCAPRTVNVDGVEVRASPSQPIFDYLNGMDLYPQWLVFDIQSITTP